MQGRGFKRNRGYPHDLAFLYEMASYEGLLFRGTAEEFYHPFPIALLFLIVNGGGRARG